MCGLSSGSRLDCKVCNRRRAEQNMNICLACIKFILRNRGKTLPGWSGTNDCQLTTIRAAICCLDATEGWNLSGTSTVKCSASSSPSGSSLSQRGNSQDPLEVGTEEAIENFKITWVDWLTGGSRECLTRRISETIYQFSQQIPNFTKLTPNIQLHL